MVNHVNMALIYNRESREISGDPNRGSAMKAIEIESSCHKVQLVVFQLVLSSATII
jgi:hypothetical protein